MADPVAWEAPLVDEERRASVDFRAFLQEIANELGALGQTTWGAPTGTGAATTFSMDWTTAVGNPPTQAEVTAIRDQLIVVQKRLGQLILDLQAAGVLG